MLFHSNLNFNKLNFSSSIFKIQSEKLKTFVWKYFSIINVVSYLNHTKAREQTTI